MTIGLSQVGLVTQAWARVIPTQWIARTEVIANASLRPISGFASSIGWVRLKADTTYSVSRLR
jgi:hypothetical protein